MARRRGQDAQRRHGEVYFTDPDQEPNPENWRTEIFQPYS